MVFNTSEKLFLFPGYLKFCLDLLNMQKKRYDQEVKINFQIYDVTTWLTKSYNTHIRVKAYKVKANGLQLYFIILIALKLASNKNKLFYSWKQTLDY